MLAGGEGGRGGGEREKERKREGGEKEREGGFKLACRSLEHRSFRCATLYISLFTSGRTVIYCVCFLYTKTQPCRDHKPKQNKQTTILTGESSTECSALDPRRGE